MDYVKFEQSEKIGRDKTLKLFPKMNLVESDDYYETWDFSGQTQNMDVPNKNFFIEVKNRKFASTNYSTAFLETEKLNNLIRIANQNDKANIFYLCFYTDKVAYCFNLRKISITDVEYSNLFLTYKTDEDLGKKDKQIIELPFEMGMKYNLKW